MALQFNVDLEFDDNDEPTFFVDELTSLKWRYEDVEQLDWKESNSKAITELRKRDSIGEIVILFDGSDACNYALLSEAIKG